MLIEVGLWVSGVLSLGLGILSVPQWSRIPEARAFFMTTVGTSVWAICIALFLAAKSEELLVAAASAYYIAAALIAFATFLLGCTVYRRTALRQLFVALASIPLFVWAVCLLVAPGVLLSEVVVGSYNTAQLNIGVYIWYIIYFLIYFVTGTILLYRSINRTKARQRNRVRHLFWGYASAGFIGMMFNLILPGLGNYHLIWIGPLGLLMFVPIVYVAIMRYGLFDIRQAAARTIAYTGTLATLAGAYIAVLTGVSAWLLPDEPTTVQYYANVVVMLCLVFAFQPIKHFFDSMTNQIFYRHQYDRDQFYREVSATLTKTTELKKLLADVSSLLAKTLKAKRVTTVVFRGDGVISSSRGGRSPIPIQDLSVLNEMVENGKVQRLGGLLINRDEVSLVGDIQLERLLVSHKVQMVLPLKYADGVLGYVLFDEHQTGRYARRDYVALETIADELVIAIQNTLSVEEIRDLNENLQQGIDEATKELRRTNAQLRRLDEAKDEFISMASHQLRTPLTSIKGYIDMMLDGDAGKVTPMQKQFLTEAFASSERMVHLIGDFLNVSRLQTGKFTIEKQPTNLVQLVTQELESLHLNAKSRGLAFSFTADKNIPELMLDGDKVRQVVMNFADNALYYSRPGATINVSIVQKGDNVVFAVKDTGIGVPEVEQANLFSKFFRATNARKQRPDGTGVGLYLAKRVITGHGGEVVFSSVEGKGSTFGFSLPVKRLGVSNHSD